MIKYPKKSAALTMRAALVKAGASQAVIDAALNVINPKAVRPLKLSAKVRTRIGELLTHTGARCVLIRNRTGIRVFSPETLAGMSASAKAHKPYLKGTAASRAKHAAKAEVKGDSTGHKAGQVARTLAAGGTNAGGL